MKKLIYAALSALLFSLSLSAQPVKETYLYAIKGQDTLYVDRHYDPSKIKTDKIPTMVYMFGGGFAYGSRGGNFAYLTDIGVQVISIDYRLGLKATGYAPVAPEVMQKAVDMALDDLSDAIAFTIKNKDEWKVDIDKVMFSGSSAGALSTLNVIYDICNEGPLSKKFPADFMPAGYIAYAGGIMANQEELSWKKKPCPMMFFHGTADTSVAIDVRRRENGSGVFGPYYIVKQLKEMEVPYYLYTEEGGDHVLSYKPFFGYNTHEIQTFVQKFVVEGLKLQMETVEKNLVEPSHLPGAQTAKK